MEVYSGLHAGKSWRSGPTNFATLAVLSSLKLKAGEQAKIKWNFSTEDDEGPNFHSGEKVTVLVPGEESSHVKKANGREGSILNEHLTQNFF